MQPPLAPDETTEQYVAPPPREGLHHASRRARDRRNPPQVAGQPNPEYVKFAAALDDAMKRQGMSASDLARQVWGSTTDKRGYSVAKNRDRISHYLAGTSFPEPQNLGLIARVLDVPVEELAAHTGGGKSTAMAALAEGAIGPRFPRPTPNTLNMATVAGRPGMIRLQVDQVIPWKVAGEIYERLNELMALAVEADAIYPYMRASAVRAADEALQEEAEVKHDRKPGDVIEGGRNGTEGG